MGSTGHVAAALGADADPVVDRAAGLPADCAGSLRQRARRAAQQDQVGVREADQPGAGGGGPHQEGGSGPRLPSLPLATRVPFPALFFCALIITCVCVCPRADVGRGNVDLVLHRPQRGQAGRPARGAGVYSEGLQLAVLLQEGRPQNGDVSQTPEVPANRQI